MRTPYSATISDKWVALLADSCLAPFGLRERVVRVFLPRKKGEALGFQILTAFKLEMGVTVKNITCNVTRNGSLVILRHCHLAPKTTSFRDKVSYLKSINPIKLIYKLASTVQEGQLVFHGLFDSKNLYVSIKLFFKIRKSLHNIFPTWWLF